MRANVTCEVCNGTKWTNDYDYTKGKPEKVTCTECNGLGCTEKEFVVHYYEYVNMGDHADIVTRPLSDIPDNITLSEFISGMWAPRYGNKIRRIEILPATKYAQMNGDLD